MNYAQKSLLERMDGLIGWIGIPHLIASPPKQGGPRRWSSLSVIISSTALLGSVSLLHKPWSLSVLMAAMSIMSSLGGAVRLSGPLKPKPVEESYDEREKLWRARSQAIGYAVVAIVAIIVLFVAAMVMLRISFVGGRKFDELTLSFALLGFGQYLMMLMLVVPTLHASWTMPPMEDEA